MWPALQLVIELRVALPCSSHRPSKENNQSNENNKHKAPKRGRSIANTLTNERCGDGNRKHKRDGKRRRQGEMHTNAGIAGLLGCVRPHPPVVIAVAVGRG